MASGSHDGYQLAGRTFVVTGGSSGIGQATCVALARYGADVLVHYHRNAQGADDTASQIRLAGRQASVVGADLRDKRDRERLIDRAWEQFGVVDGWIHNAGADVLTGNAAQWSFEQKFELLWNVDVQGTTLLARQVAQRMLANLNASDHRACMVFVGWDQAHAGMDGDAGQMFGPIKSAVMALSASMAQELAPDVRVNCVAPGWIRTGWGEQTDEKWHRRACDSSLLQRWGTPQEVADAIVFLCSDAARFINGQTLEVNGGWNRGGHRWQSSDKEKK